MSLPLTGIGVLVTRPAHQATALCHLLEDQGAIPFPFPTLEITDPEDVTVLRTVLAQLKKFDLAIFVSPNAVVRAWNWIQAAGGLPSELTIAAVGQGSARELARLGWHAQLVPTERFNSEALLALPCLTEMSGQRVVIFRGEGGRELLADELTRRGATVVYAEVYRRVKPDANLTELTRHLASNTLQIAVITSSEGLRNLNDLLDLPGQDWLRNVKLVVFSDRTANLARELGLQGPIHVARPATDIAVLETIIQSVIR